MNIVDTFVKNLNEDERLSILKDNIEFEENGFIGECMLRSKAKELGDSIGYNSNITLMMYTLVNGIYKYYTYKYLSL